MEDWALEDWALVEDGGLTPTCNNETYHADVHFMKLTIRGGRWRSRLPNTILLQTLYSVFYCPNG